MSSWRTFGIGAAAISVTAFVGGTLTSAMVVAPPVIAALVVLLIAALSVDYFGITRRKTGWTGLVTPTRVSRAMMSALERRFAREREAGGIRAHAVARALLISLAEHRELRRAAGVVDFLATEAATRAHRDVDGDALRALALAELGRLAEARVVDHGLGERAGGVPVVAFVRGRIAELGGQVPLGLAHVERGQRAARGAVARDLGVMRARLLARCGRLEDAREELGRIAAAGDRAAVEALIAPDAAVDVGVALAARQALGLAAVYR
jgi:hypothetical protein